MTGSPSIETQHGHAGIVLATLSLANVMALLDLFVVNVALHDIGVGLHYQSSLPDWALGVSGSSGDGVGALGDGPRNAPPTPGARIT